MAPDFKKIDFAYGLGVLLLMAGWFFALLPHAFHARAGFAEESHEQHVLTGVVLVVLGLGVLVWNSRRSPAAARKK